MLPTASCSDSSSAPREPACSRARASSSRGWTTRAPAATTIASPWTSSTSPASTTMSVRPRRPASARAVCTAPAARTDGTGRRPGPRARRPHRTGRGPRCPRGRRRARPAPSRSSATSSPASPLAAGQVASSRRTARCGARERSRTASSRPVEVDDDRATDADGLGARGHPAQERRPAAELHLEVHDRPLALGVDRRVGDLRERLAEVVAGGTRDARRARRAACRRPCSTAARARRAPSSARRGAASRRRARTGSAGRGSSRRRPRAPEPRQRSADGSGAPGPRSGPRRRRRPRAGRRGAAGGAGPTTSRRRP